MEVIEVKKITFDKILSLPEGIVLLGCSGFEDWIKGVTYLLIDEGILNDKENAWDKIYWTRTTGGRTDLILTFGKAEFDMGKMAMWRLRFGDCSWISDYKVNYASQHGWSE